MEPARVPFLQFVHNNVANKLYCSLFLYIFIVNKKGEQSCLFENANAN